MKKYITDEKNEDKLMLEVQEFVRKDEKNGKTLWDVLFHEDIRIKNLTAQRKKALEIF